MSEICNSTEDVTTTGGRLREARLTLRLTQSEFSEICGVKLSTLKNYEATASEPSTESLRLLMSIGINPGWIIAGQLPIFVEAPKPVQYTKQELLLKARQLVEEEIVIVKQFLEQGQRLAALMENSGEMDQVNAAFLAPLEKLEGMRERTAGS